MYVKDIDTENHKVSLGYKNSEDNPWEQLKNNYPIGSTFHAPVVSPVSYTHLDVYKRQGVGPLVLAYTEMIARK